MGPPVTPERIAAAAAKAAFGLERPGALVASPEYRARLTCVMARRALEAAVRRAGDGHTVARETAASGVRTPP